MDFRLISVRGQLSGRVSLSGLVVAERYGYGCGPGVAPGRAAGSTSGCFGQGIARAAAARLATVVVTGGTGWASRASEELRIRPLTGSDR